MRLLAEQDFIENERYLRHRLLYQIERGSMKGGELKKKRGKITKRKCKSETFSIILFSHNKNWVKQSLVTSYDGKLRYAYNKEMN